MNEGWRGEKGEKRGVAIGRSGIGTGDVSLGIGK